MKNTNSNVFLVFPFRIDGVEHRVNINTLFIRKENAVSFIIPFPAFVSVDAKKTYTVHYNTEKKEKNNCSTQSICVCIEFKSLNDAIMFEKERTVHISYLKPSECKLIDEQIEKVSLQLDKTSAYWKNRKRRYAVDTEGYRIA